jgi:hypothetical protein
MPFRGHPHKTASLSARADPSAPRKGPCSRGSFAVHRSIVGFQSTNAYLNSLFRDSTFGKAKAQEPISELPDIAPSFNPSFTPMAGATKQVHDKVWVRVLYFAMSVPELANNPLSAWSVPPRLPLLLVSKTFNARITKSIYYIALIYFL